jgi:large subunit ribosomal protein L24
MFAEFLLNGTQTAINFKRGRVISVDRVKNRVLVQGVMMVKRHTRPNPQRNIKGGIAEREATIHVSNLMIVSSGADRRTRIGFETLADGRKVRIGRRDGGELDK